MDRKWKGGVGIVLAKKWVDNVVNIIGVSDRMIVNKVFVQRNILSPIFDRTAYALQCGLDDSQKDDFYDSLISVVGKIVEK